MATLEKQLVLYKIKKKNSSLNHWWSGSSPNSPLVMYSPHLCIGQNLRYRALSSDCSCGRIWYTHKPQTLAVVMHLLLGATASGPVHALTSSTVSWTLLSFVSFIEYLPGTIVSVQCVLFLMRILGRKQALLHSFLSQRHWKTKWLGQGLLASKLNKLRSTTVMCQTLEPCSGCGHKCSNEWLMNKWRRILEMKHATYSFLRQGHGRSWLEEAQSRFTHKGARF